MSEDGNTALERLKAQRYTASNRLSSVKTRLKGKNLSDEKREEYEARRRALDAERLRLTAEISALEAKAK